MRDAGQPACCSRGVALATGGSGEAARARRPRAFGQGASPVGSGHTLQEEEKAAEKAVNEALLKLGNLVHDSVRVDDNEARLWGSAL